MSDANPPGGSGLPARRLSSQELEAVIRRAVELQSVGEVGDDGVSEVEVLRIGKELGLTPELVRRAIADVRSQPVEEHGFLAGLMGAGRVRAVRTLRRPAAQLGLFLEEYLGRCEFMVVQRRFPDRTRYVRGTGVAAVLGRAASKMGARQAALDLQQLDVGVSMVDEGSALVELSVDLSTVRTGLATGGLVGGTGAGTGVALSIWAAHLATPLALVGVPVLAGIVLGSRLIYGSVASRTEEKLQGFLDRLEHGDVKLPASGGKPDWRKQLGI